MATQLFLRANNGAQPSIHRALNTNNLAGAAVGWWVNGITTTRGAALQTVVATTVAGPTNGIEPVNTSGAVEFISFPLSAAVTIAGTITLNIWAHESVATVNAAVNVVIDRLDPSLNVVSEVARTARTVEVGTTSAVNNFTVTPTSTAFLEGDRIRVRVFFDDSTANMAAGTATVSVSGASAGANGDTYVTFTETFTCHLTEPTGTILYPTSTAGPAVGANTEMEMWTARGGAAVTAVTNSTNGWVAPTQWTATAGGTAIEWYSRPLTAFTLAGLVRVNMRSWESSASANAGIRTELAVCETDGSGAVVWATAGLIDTATPNAAVGAGTGASGELTTAQAAIRAWLGGRPTAVTNGQRLRLRVFVDDNSNIPRVAGFTASLAYNGTAAGATGDTWIQLPQTVTATPVVSQASYGFYADGTETGSTALAGPDINPAVDIGGGDVNLQLRVLLQTTGVTPTPATDDWQLEFQKNSGAWQTFPAVETLTSGYEPFNSTIIIGSTSRGAGESFLGTGAKLKRAGFSIYRSASPPSTITAAVYAHSGTFGTNGIPVDPPLAVSINSVAGASLPTTTTWTYFDFDETVTLVNGVPYVIALITDVVNDGTNYVIVSAHTLSPTHPGNRSARSNTLVWTSTTNDLAFRVYTVDVGNTVVTYDSPNLTHATATTRRLTAGSGSFVAGKVSEAGYVRDLGWAGDSYTEVLYSLTLKQADLVAGDTLKFRVLRNGAVTGMTYTQVPTLTLTAAPVLTAVGKDLGAVWHTRVPAAKTLQTVWHTRSNLGDTLNSLWGVRTSVADMLQSLWGVRTKVADQSDLRWVTRARIGDQAALQWSTRGAAGDTLDTRWRTAQRIGDTSDLRWNVRARISDQSDLRWAVRTPVFDTSDLRWTIRAAAARSLQMVWSTEAYFFPNAIPSLAAWYDASDLATITDAGGGAVSQWNDKSGLGRHLSQSNAGERPKTGIHTQNGRNVLTLVRVNHLTHDAGSDAMDLSPVTTFVVCYNTSTDSNPRILTVRQSVEGNPDYGVPNGILGHMGGASSPTSLWGAYSNGPTPTVPTNNNAWFLGRSVLNNTVSYVAVNGVAGTAGTYVAPANMRYLRMGAGCYQSGSPPSHYGGAGEWAGRVAEIVIYNATLSAGEITQVEDYLNQKWLSTASVGKNLNAQWSTRTKVSDTLSVPWSVRTKTTDTLAAVWQVRVPAADALTTVWHVRRTQADTINPQWVVRTKVGDQADLRWGVRTRVGDTVQGLWSTRVALGDALTVPWSVRSLVADTLNAQWRLRAGIGNTTTLLWNIEAAPSITQSAYQFFVATGTESDAAPLAPQDTPITGNLVNVVGYGQVRVRLQSTTAVPVDATEDFRLQYEKNGSGTWIDLASSADTAFPHDAPSLTDGEPTTQRLTGGTGTFTPGKVSKTGTVTDVGWAGNGHTELLFSAKLIAADLVEGDTLRFRVANPYISEALGRAPIELPEVLLVSEVGGYRLYTKIAGVLTLVGLYTKVAGLLTQVPVVRPSVATATLFDTRVPNTADSTSSGLVLGHHFTASVAGSVVGLRYYRQPALTTGTRIGGLYTAGGATLIETNFTGETASGWQTMAITPMPLTAGAGYGVSIYYPTGRPQYEDNVFNSVYTSGVLSAPAGAGRWGVGATGPGLPVNTGNSWYGCDVVFQPGLYPVNNLFGSTLPGAFDSSTAQVEVGMRFRSSVAGTITGVRFYKDSTSGGVHTGSIYDNAGTLLTRGEFAGETPSGWQQQLFGTPVSIAANTTYVVGVFFGAGRYNYTLNKFNSVFTNGPLSAPAGGTTSTDFNGCYVYGGNPGFPVNGNGASDAWFGIDVVFQPT